MRFLAQRHTTVVSTEANKAPPPLSIENDHIFVNSPSANEQEDLDPPRIDRGISKASLLFQPMQQFCQSQPSQQPLSHTVNT